MEIQHPINFPSEKARQQYYKNLELKRNAQDKKVTEKLVEVNKSLKNQDIKAPEIDDAELVLNKQALEQKFRVNMLALVDNNQNKLSIIIKKFKSGLYRDFLQFYPGIFEEVKKQNTKLLSGEEVVQLVERIILKYRNNDVARDDLNQLVTQREQAEVDAREQQRVTAEKAAVNQALTSLNPTLEDLARIEPVINTMQDIIKKNL
jgi:hypothetical protein